MMARVMRRGEYSLEMVLGGVEGWFVGLVCFESFVR